LDGSAVDRKAREIRQNPETDEKFYKPGDGYAETRRRTRIPPPKRRETKSERAEDGKSKKIVDALLAGLLLLVL